MNLYSNLKAIWKKLNINGQLINYSSKYLWVIETERGPRAYVLKPGYKTHPEIDIDGFKRYDGDHIEGHKNWWKFYDFSTVDVYDNGNKLKLSVITKVAVDENHFNPPVYQDKKLFGLPIKAIVDVKRDRKGAIQSYFITGTGWTGFEETLTMVCHHEVDNARPVFPKNGRPYIRTKRDESIINNLSLRGKA